jgi:hypothetical protein
MGDLQLCQGGGKHIENYGRWFQVVSTSFTCILYWSKYPEIGSVWSAWASAGATLQHLSMLYHLMYRFRLRAARVVMLVTLLPRFAPLMVAAMLATTTVVK